MTSPDDISRMSAEVTNALGVTIIVAEAVVGYRTKLVEGGVGLETADKMASEYHSVLLDMVRAGTSGAAKS